MTSNCMQELLSEEKNKNDDSYPIINMGDKGILCYDSVLEQFFVKDKYGQYNYLSFSKNYFNKGTKKIKKENDKLVAYHGIWKDGISYEKNTIVKYHGELYVSLKNNNTLFPNNTIYWEILTRSVNVHLNWNSTQKYHEKDIVIHQNNLYISKEANNTSFVSDSNKWLTIDNKTEYNIFNIVYTNSSCCYHYDPQVKYSVFNKCSQHLSLKDSNIYDVTIIDIDRDIYIIPFALVGKGSPYLEFNNSTHIITIKEGYYRCVYNISYSGSIYDVIFKISFTDGEKLDGISNSYRRDVNRSRVDNFSDNFYEDPNKDFNELIKCVNHIFYVPIKNDKQLVFNMHFNDYNKGKKMSIYPVKTWITFERIAEV